MKVYVEMCACACTYALSNRQTPYRNTNAMWFIKFVLNPNWNAQPCPTLNNHQIGSMGFVDLKISGCVRCPYFSKSESSKCNFEVCYQFFQVFRTVTFVPLELYNGFFKIEVQWVRTQITDNKTKYKKIQDVFEWYLFFFLKIPSWSAIETWLSRLIDWLIDCFFFQKNARCKQITAHELKEKTCKWKCDNHASHYFSIVVAAAAFLLASVFSSLFGVGSKTSVK